MQVVGEWGQAGEGPGKLTLPVSLATNRDGLIFVADAGSGFVHKFDWNGQPLASFNHPRMQRPSGIAVDDGGAVYVADYSANRVFIFYPDGRLLREIRGSARLALSGPVGVAVDSEGSIYVLEFDASRIQKFDARGRFQTSWGKDGEGPGEFHFPADLAIGPDGFLYVADTYNQRVQKFTREGQFVAQWSLPGTPQGQMAEATGITVTDEAVFLADSGNQRVQAWNLNGTLRHTDTLGDRFHDAYETPTDVAVGRNGELLVLDPSRPRILRVKVNLGGS